jgi:hypothetical protein
MGEIDGLLVDPGVYADGERVRALGQERRDCEQALAPLEAEWAQRAERG